MIGTKPESPLVSIIVITYNSSKYIIETLDSAYSQTYDAIELIVSDDCSTDNTMELVKSWMGNHKNRFLREVIITTPVNTGVPANCNRGAKSANGEWIKFLAGDDILLDDCISLNIEFIKKTNNAKFVFSKLNIIKNNTLTDIFNYNEKFLSLNSQQQLRLLSFSNTINAITEFINKETLARLNFFDERYFGLEDYPMWVKATISGYKLYGFNEVTCKYRLHDTNFSISKSTIFKRKLHKDLLKFYWSEVLLIGLKKFYLTSIMYIVCYTIISFIIILNGNKRNKINNRLLWLDQLIKFNLIKITKI
jgi:glycosyltransferase involved in cell wall biosynthesis